MENKETVKVGDTELTREEIDCIFAGIRPKDMDFELFKKLRKNMKHGLKGYLKGKYFFISSTVKPAGKDKPDGLYTKHTATYVKEK